MTRRAFFFAFWQEREIGLLLLICLITAAVSWKDPRFLSSQNLRDIVIRSAPTAIVACGLMLVVVTGEIDISVGSLMALLAAILGALVSDERMQASLWIGIPITLLAGTAMGLLTGLLVVIGRVPSIMATLGLMTALRGITTWVMAGENIAALPTSLTAATRQGIAGIPIGVWIAALVISWTAILIHHTPIGRRLFAVGSSRESARLVGLHEGRLKLFVFGYTGFLTAVATVIDVPRLPKIESGIGAGFELLVVTCVVVGGVAISGGRGRLIGVMLAVILMTMIPPVLTFWDLGEAGEKWSKAIQGVCVILAVTRIRFVTIKHVTTASHSVSLLA